MKTEHPYPISFSGMHGCGKKTLRDGLCAATEGYHPIHYKLLELGRMVDEDGLHVFRARAREQDRLVREAIAQGGQAVTSRLGILDVAITACTMARLGRIDADIVDAFVASLGEDIEHAALPRTLAVVLTPAATLQERLLARDQQAGASNTRGQAKLARMVDFMEEIFVQGICPHPVIERLVGSYRERDALLLVDTGRRDRAAALADVQAFLAQGQGNRAVALAEGGVAA
jgi:hypothetical protein